MSEQRLREVVWDLAGSMLVQGDLERIIAEANAPGDEQLVTITIKRIVRYQTLPRLILDYGDLIHRVVAEMDRREKENNEKT